jgi:transposase
VDEFIVCDPVKNGVYKKAKTDKLDAKNLAALLRGGFLHPVYHDGSERQQFRALMSGYQDIVDTGVRIKNRYASLFRKAGMRQRGSAFYGDESLLNDLPRPDQRFVAKSFYGMIASIEKQREIYVAEIKKRSRGFREIKLLKTIPGIGDIQAAKIVSQVVTPERFKNKHKFYSYCGLVRLTQSSGGRDYPSARTHGNRILKCVYKMAAHSAVAGSSALREYYDRLRDQGVNAKAAKNAVSRKIAAISLGVWKNGSKYDDALILESVKS